MAKRQDTGKAPEVDRADANEERNGARLVVEVISEGPHCVPCEYAVAAVDYVAEDYAGRIEVRVIETKHPAGARRYLELCSTHGERLPMPSILLDGRVAFRNVPGPDDLSQALDEALAIRERHS
jgi:hypothetical protein